MTAYLIVVMILYGLATIYNYWKFIEDMDTAYGGALLMDAALFLWGAWLLIR